MARQPLPRLDKRQTTNFLVVRQMAPKRGTDWFVRVSRTYEEIQPWIQNLSTKCTKLMVYQHDADEDVNRTHCHLMIIGYTTSDETMKIQLTKCLGERPAAGDWAWDPVVRSELDAITYMSKKDLQPQFNKGYEDKIVAEASAKYLPKSEYSKNSNSKTQYKVVSEKPAESKKRQNDLLDEMASRLKNFRKREVEEFPIVSSLQAEVEQKVFVWNATQVIDVIIEVLNEHRVIFGRYKVRDYYDTLQSRLNPQSFKMNILQMVSYKSSCL